LWVGLFNLVLVTQFWSFTNDLYSQDQGKRLFAIIGIGSSLGAIFGAEVASRLFLLFGAYALMLVAGGVLVVCMMLTSMVHPRERKSHSVRPRLVRKPMKSDGGFQLILKHRYLYLIALLVLLSNTVNSTGEFILGKTVTEQASAA